MFGFPAPEGYSETKYITYDSTDKFEKILTKYSREKGKNKSKKNWQISQK